MYKTLKYLITSFVYTAIFLVFTPTLIYAWDNTGGGDHGGQDWTISTNTTVAGVHTNVGTFTINNGVAVVVQGFDGTNYGNFEVQANTITLNGTIDGSQKGFRGLTSGSGTGEGTGGGVGVASCSANQGGGGGGHGGYGGTGGGGSPGAGGAANDSYLTPSLKGSAGGAGNPSGTCVAGGNGGAAIKLTATGTLTVGAAISANGQGNLSRSGGGSGGTIHLVASTLAGSAGLSANGGSTSELGGGGSGGRVILHYTSANNYSGTITATGGSSVSGTAGQVGTVIIKNDTTNDITLPTTQFWYANPALEGSTQNFRDVSLTNNSTLNLKGYYTTNSDGVGFVFNVRNFTINTGSTLQGTGFGYLGVSCANGSGPSPGQGYNQANTGGGGGGHGGKGGTGNGSPTRTGGYPVDSLLTPVQLGSSGGGAVPSGCAAGANGGSAVKINASDTITVSGAINMNGATATSRTGGGAGGSVLLITQTLAGTAAISANGGAGAELGAGGAGGRIALHYSSANNYSGTVTATGGAGGTGTAGENGTVVIVNDTTNDITLPTTQFWRADPTLEGGLGSFRDFALTNNSVLNVWGYYTNNSDGVGLNLNVRNFTINTGSSINGNSLGYQGVVGANGAGPAFGQGGCAGNVGAGGAGHGGAGANGQSNINLGGGVVGSATAPVLLGSSGGGGNPGSCIAGGHGGSAIKINASGAVNLSGTISMNGGSGGTRAGAGAGGSIYIISNSLNGASNLSATGGNETDIGGSGGGGRIAVAYQTTNSWSGSMLVAGGTGGNGSGGAGSSTTIALPQTPTSLTQYKSDGTTVIATGAQTSETTVILKSSVAAAANFTLTEEVEVQQIGTSFTNIPTATSSGVAYSGTPVTASATVTGLTDATNYHWQSRTCVPSTGNCSAWVAYGGNPYDFRVFTNRTPDNPSNLGPANLVDGSATNSNAPTLTFTISDPDVSNSLYYTIQISTVSNYSTQVVEFVSDPGTQGTKSFTVGQSGGGTYLTPIGGGMGQTLVNGSYYWRVKVADENISSDWTEARIGSPAFVVDASNPDTNASGLDFTNANDNDWTAVEPTITWTAGSDVGAGTLLGYCISLSETAVGDPAPNTNPTSSGGVLDGLDDGVDETYCPYIATGTSLNLSTITGLTLTTNKQYYVSIAAVDTAGNFYAGADNTIKNLISFKYDSLSPTNVTAISTPGGSFSNVDEMYFSWPTSAPNTASDTGGSGLLGYQYSINDQNDWHGTVTDTNTGLSIVPVATTPPLNLDNTRDGSSVSVGENIIYFRSVDSAGNFSSGSTYRTASISYGGEAPTFPGNATVTIDPSVATENSFSISWDAATPATNRTIAKYYWMVNTLPPAISSPPDKSYQTMIDNPGTYFETTSTSVAAQALPAVVRGANKVYVIAVDDLDNYSPSNYIFASFTLNTDAPDSPKNLTVSDASIKEASLWRASLAWDTPDYVGLGDLLYTVQRSTDGNTWTTIGTTSGTAFVDTVASSSRYYWRVGTNDSGGQNNSDPNWSNAVTMIPKGSYSSAPDLTSGPVVTGITTKKAKISWTTSRSGDSKVAFGTETGKYGDEEPSNSSQVTDHVINLTNLSPGTKYYYVVKWTDEDGNTGVSEEKSFSTESAPIIKDVSISNLSIDSAIINFTTIHASKVKIYFGKSSDFGGVKEIETSTLESNYSAMLENLEDGTKYYYKINGFDTENAEYEGTTLDLTTLPRPKISNVKLQQVADTAESTILVTWESNTDITSIISVYPTDTPSSVRNIVDLTFKEGGHSMVVSSLLPATDYTLIVKGSDKVGNQAVSGTVTFTTSTDTRPPAIINLKVIGGTIPPVGFAAGSVNAQLVVTWDTDEPATSQVEFGEGSGTEYSSKSTEDSNLTTNHVVVISGLTPSQVYHLRAVSLDAAKNDGRSIDTVTIAPKATRSALDLVMSNLSQIFGNIKLLQQ